MKYNFGILSECKRETRRGRWLEAGRSMDHSILSNLTEAYRSAELPDNTLGKKLGVRGVEAIWKDLHWSLGMPALASALIRYANNAKSQP